MVSLLDLYNIKEIPLREVKVNRDPARGNKSINREKDFELVSGEPDPETGKISSKVVRKISISNALTDLEAEIQDFKKLVEDKPEDIVLFNISEELNEIYNNFRTHIRKKYPEEYKKVQEANMTGGGASFNAGKGMGHFGRKKKNTKSGYMGYSEPVKMKK